LVFVPSSADACLYVKTYPNGDKVIVVLYVDDLIVAGSSLDAVNGFKADMMKQYKMKDLGELRWILGMEVIRDRKEGTLTIRQPAYIEQLLDRFGMGDCHEAPTPIVKVLPRLDAESGATSDPQYMSLVGAGLYAVMMVRPDAAFAVSHLGRHLQATGDDHWQAGMRLLRFFKGTKGRGLTYGCCYDRTVKIYGFADSDWGGDLGTRKSTTGYIFMLGGAAVSWACKLQYTVALSTTEAEYMALSAATQEAIYLRCLPGDLGYEQTEPTMIYVDNTAAIALSENPGDHQRTKHIDMRYYFAREKVEAGEIKVVHVPTKDRWLIL